MAPACRCANPQTDFTRGDDNGRRVKHSRRPEPAPVTPVVRHAFAIALLSWSVSAPAESAAPRFPCETPLPLGHSIVLRDYYTDSARSLPDPARRQAYDEATGSIRKAAQAVDAMADGYRATGDSAAAQCAAAWFESYARQGALLDTGGSSQSVYVQGWIGASLAIAWLKVRNADIPEPERRQIVQWLAALARRNVAYYDGRPPGARDARNNLRYWAGLTALAAGLAADRHDLIDWGVASYRLGVDQIADDGTLPLEMQRKSMALHYHLFAAAPLVTIAELAELNDIPLYSYRDGALGRLVERALSGTADASFFANRTGVAQKRGELLPEDVVWAAPFLRRFPHPGLMAIVQKFPQGTMLYIGGLPLN